MYQRYTRIISIFSFWKSTKDFHMINICLDSNTKSCCWSIVAVLYRTLVKIFAIYCYLTFTCFWIVRFQPMHQIVYTLKLFLLLPLPLNHSNQLCWPSVFCIVVQFFSTYFLSSLFCQQPFWIFISVILKFV